MTEALEPEKPGPAESDPGRSTDLLEVQAAASGDRAAFDRLVLRHQQAVIDAASYYLGNSQVALEVAQEAFLKAYRAVDRFRGDALFRTWLLRITMNTARSFQTRRRAKKRSAPIVSIHSAGGRADDGNDAHDIEIADFSSTPDVLLERKEVKEVLETAIASLEEDARELIVMRDILGESYDAIADQFGLPIGTVKSKVHRARLVLREKLTRFL